MKATGIVRKPSKLGHFVLPIKLRRILKIEVKDALEMFIDDDLLVLKKCKPACFFCKSTINVKMFNRKIVCGKCIDTIRSLFA